MDCQCRGPDIIIRASIRDDNHDLAFVGFGFAEKLLCRVGDGSTGAGPAAPVVDALDGVQQLGFVVVLAEGKLQPLLVGVLHSADPRVRVWDLELPRDVGHKLQHRAEVARPHAAGAVYDKGDVVGVEAGFAAHQAVCVAHSLHQGLHGFPQGKPAVHRKREETVCPAHGLRDKTTHRALNCFDFYHEAQAHFWDGVCHLPCQQSWPRQGSASHCRRDPRWWRRRCWCRTRVRVETPLPPCLWANRPLVSQPRLELLLGFHWHHWSSACWCSGGLFLSRHQGATGRFLMVLLYASLGQKAEEYKNSHFITKLKLILYVNNRLEYKMTQNWLLYRKYWMPYKNFT